MINLQLKGSRQQPKRITPSSRDCRGDWAIPIPIKYQIYSFFQKLNPLPVHYTNDGLKTHHMSNLKYQNKGSFQIQGKFSLNNGKLSNQIGQNSNSSQTKLPDSNLNLKDPILIPQSKFMTGSIVDKNRGSLKSAGVGQI